jgi:hypothetical protein
MGGATMQLHVLPYSPVAVSLPAKIYGINEAKRVQVNRGGKHLYRAACDSLGVNCPLQKAFCPPRRLAGWAEPNEIRWSTTKS